MTCIPDGKNFTHVQPCRHADVWLCYNQSKNMFNGGHNGLDFGARMGFTYWYWYFSCFTGFYDFHIGKADETSKRTKAFTKEKGIEKKSVLREKLGSSQK